jgi:hypothetical protein
MLTVDPYTTPTTEYEPRIAEVRRGYNFVTYATFHVFWHVVQSQTSYRILNWLVTHSSHDIDQVSISQKSVTQAKVDTPADASTLRKNNFENRVLD